MLRISLAVFLIALFLLVCSWPRAKTDEAVPHTKSPVTPLPLASKNDFREIIEIPNRAVLLIPGSLAFPPGNWMLVDLVGYLEVKGVRVEVKSSDSFNQPERPALVLSTGSDTDDTLASVLVYRCRDARSARNVSLTMGPNAYSRGLFAFGPLSTTTRTSKLLQEISAALLQRPFD